MPCQKVLSVGSGTGEAAYKRVIPPKNRYDPKRLRHIHRKRPFACLRPSLPHDLDQRS